jgi:hypothetical protein
MINIKTLIAASLLTCVAAASFAQAPAAPKGGDYSPAATTATAPADAASKPKAHKAKKAHTKKAKTVKAKKASTAKKADAAASAAK